MALFDPITLGDVTLPNRIVVSPMSQYIAQAGFANTWHTVHLGRFALGGAGLVFTEATAVEDRGRRTAGDLGLWRDDQIDPLLPAVRFIAGEGSVPGIQLGHAGRKASERRPWHGETPITEEDVALRGEAPWPTIAPSALPYGPDWHVPEEMDEAAIAAVLDAFRAAARRSFDAGFQVIDLYGGHGFLMHQFLSPAANRRGDRWGGSLENRMRFPLAVIDAVRAEWPERLPLFYRLSATDWLEGGLEVEDTVAFAAEAKAHGVTVMDVSTGGIGGDLPKKRMPVAPAFQVPFAEQIRREAGVATMAVGLILDAETADGIVASGQADLIALAREVLDDPNWALHAAGKLGLDPDFDRWRPQFGWWLNKGERALKKLGVR